MHWKLLVSALLAVLPAAHAKTAWQQRRFDAAVPSTKNSTFTADSFKTKNDALAALASVLGTSSPVTRSGDLLYGQSIGRIWTDQNKIFPDAIVFPSSAEDVSTIIQFYSHANTLWKDGFAIIGGGHGGTGGAQSPSVVIDLRLVNTTEIISSKSNATEPPVLKIGGGAEAGSVYTALDGTGWAFLGPRAASIGVGGFLLGGGIAFQTGKYGVAVDSLLGIEVVLIDGRIVYANPYNEYKDLFWAATGGGWLGFGVITNFYIQAYPDPGAAYVATIAWGEDKAEEVFKLTTEFFETNTDPEAFPALLYYFKDPKDITSLVPIASRQFTLQLNAVHFGGGWEALNASYSKFYPNADTLQLQKFTILELDQYLLTNYPYGYHREFFGKSHTNSTVDFYRNTFSIYKQTVLGMMERGEDPGHTFWVDEYVFPGWSGTGPEHDSDTAWPHSTSAHITLTSGEWSSDNTTQYMYDRERDGMMAYLREFQNGLGGAPIYDYPNYITPYSKPAEVWSADNFRRLTAIKEKYDPACLLNRGRVPPTSACLKKGFANTFL
ncbi:hypothetical protein COCC4DRAFT_24647 [Bipolaris maydis ATCC 48331]|uniref:FAD-binding PCMH-type domain-containing protein n=2 Tax=Cochliobolus heterostrophus TaxID=5016 RepID=M2SNG7_COCH5|nr:uncharacterized protein COCC4DRAFT_24647 [Bipolaris maydis ATCC 48331]EMD86840.1 hypothetical protein COCHEDRAFT_1034083 [Bipolaris maydis C5]KAJ5021167.1 hypothetical protein J3E73DRAFT_262265 [Bipolaris maydis]ENI04163.1 hypothetical protein COCC4DRAFT_24647 [Bipolaris maydis ATCC 48331]KAJ6204177.1 hypothetical protein PSV09DRAFT_1034083 [Bipolaris maydis]KAJ6265900.1 hypothetical protein PSV08DRAFT_356948 [Bipolaris maydis]